MQTDFALDAREQALYVRQPWRHGVPEAPKRPQHPGVSIRYSERFAKAGIEPSVGPRHTAEKALTAVIQEAYVQGISTRSLGELVKALGMSGVSKSQVNRRYM